MAHFKAVGTAMTTASSLTKSRDIHSSKSGSSSSSKASSRRLENCVDEGHSTPPHVLATNGDLDALQDSVKAFGLTLRERDSNKATLLHHAARAHQLPIMQLLINRGIELDAMDQSGNTALHLAAMASHADGINLLLEAGASCSILNHERNSPLHLAAMDLSGNSLRACLSHPINIYVRGPRNRTLLHILSETDNVEGCKAIRGYMDRQPVSSGVEPLKSCDDDGFTPIHLAARKNAHKVLELVVSCWKDLGRSTEILFDLIDEENSTPLHVAVDGGNYEVVCVLLKYGACPYVLKEDVSPPLHLACSLGRLDIVKAMVEHAGVEILHRLDRCQRSPLHYSALSIHCTSVISYILEEGKQAVNINQQDSKGKTPLHAAISSGNLASVKEFLSRGADPFLKDENGSNALHLAVLHDKKPIIHELLKVPNSSQLITEVNCKGYSPVHIGLTLGLGDIMLEMVSSVLAQYHPQCTHVNDSLGNNYVHLAAASGDCKLMLELLDMPNAQKLLNDTNKCGRTPLHCAAKKGLSHCVEHLLNRGAMVHKCYKGMTPLMVACTEGHVDCAKLLYKAHPFQLDWQDDVGDTALHHAARSGCPSMIQYMLDLNSKIFHNDSGQSFLDLIIESHNEDCGLAVVNHKRWQESLDMISPVGDAPMLNLIKRMPGIAKAVLDRCYRKERSLHGRGYSEVFQFKYLLCLDNTWLETAEKDQLFSGDKPTISEFDVEAGHSIVNFQRSVTRKSLFLESKKKVSQTMEVLLAMIKHKRVDLLIHPVVLEYIRMKWRWYGLLLYSFIHLLIYLNIIFLTSFVVFGSSPPASANDSSSLSINASGAMELEQNVTVDATTFAQDSRQINGVGQVLQWLTVCLNSIVVVFQITLLIWQGLKCDLLQIVQINTWVNVASCVLTYIFLLHPNPFDVKNVLFGAGACFLSWLVLFWSLRFVSVIGIYVTMFFKILRRALQVLVLCAILLMAFALPLFLLGRSIIDFSSLRFSLFSVFGYMLGDIQYGMFIENAGRPHSSILIIFVVILAIMMTIVMANLLIGLAVGDIEQIKQNALYDKMVMEAEFFLRWDENMPKFLYRKVVDLFVHSNDENLPRFHHLKVVGDPNLKWWRRGLWNIGMIGNKVLDPINRTERAADEESSTIDAPIDVAYEISQIKLKLQEITDVLRSSQSGKDGSSDYYHRQRTQQLHWQMPESSISLGSSHSDYQTSQML